MAALSDYLESGIISHLFFGETFTPPTSLALALTSGVPRDNDDGSTMFELPSGQSKGLNFVSTNYSRVNLGSAATGSGTWNQVGVDDRRCMHDGQLRHNLLTLVLLVLIKG